MDENLHNIEDLFHSALDDIEEKPSENVWEAIDKRLDKDNVVSIKRKYTNLKRIAVLLLLLVLSFTLYEINFIYKNNRFSKNNNTGAESRHNSGKTNDETLGKTNEIKSTAVPDKNNNPGNSNEKNDLVSVYDNISNDSNSLPDLQHPGQGNKQNLKKKNITEITNSENDIKKTQPGLTSNQKKKLTTKSAYRVKIKNAVPVEDEQMLVKNNDEQVDKQIFLLQKQGSNLLVDGENLAPKDSIAPKKLPQIIDSAIIKQRDSISTSVAKNEQKKKKRASRFFITPFFSPDLAWYHLQDDKVDNQSGNASEIEQDEKHEFSSTVGALVDYKINKHWGLQSGLTLSNTNITVDPQTIYAQSDNTGNIKYRINTSSGYGYILPPFISNPAIGDSLYVFTSTHSLQYIGIPLALTYNISKGKFGFKVLAGVSANILTKAKLETTVEKGFNNSVEALNNLQGLKKVYFSGLAAVGVDYMLTKRTSLVFTPVMRFALNSINKDAPVKSYPMSLGLTIGLKIGL